MPCANRNSTAYGSLGPGDTLLRYATCRLCYNCLNCCCDPSPHHVGGIPRGGRHTARRWAYRAKVHGQRHHTVEADYGGPNLTR